MEAVGNVSCIIDGAERFTYRDFRAGNVLRRDHQDRCKKLVDAGTRISPGLQIIPVVLI